jgi:uncharacterized membrane protein YbhN (UPF0104 family)
MGLNKLTSKAKLATLNPQVTKIGWRLARWLITLSVLVLMGGALYQSRHEFNQALGGANWGWLALALALNLFSSFIYVFVWDSCARQFGATGGYRGALVALSVAGAARYVPGGIWPIAGLVYFGPNVGLPRRQMPVLAALAQVLHLLAAGIVAVLAFILVVLEVPSENLNAEQDLAGLGLALILGVATLFGLPRYLKPVFNRLLKTNQKVKLEKPAGFSALFWLLNGVRLWWLALAFSPATPQLLPLLICAGAATTLLSGLFFFVPLGLGVVEFSLGWWLALVLPLPQVVAVVALNRLLRIINDFLFLALIRFL